MPCKSIIRNFDRNYHPFCAQNFLTTEFCSLAQPLSRQNLPRIQTELTFYSRKYAIIATIGLFSVAVPTTQSLMANILLLGCGYVGNRFASQCRLKGDKVLAVTRSTATFKYSSLVDDLIEFDWTDSRATLRANLQADVLVCCVSHRVPEDSGVPQNSHREGLARVLGQLATPPKRIIYLSTTGVYAPADSGEWVDECSPCSPDRPSTRNAYEAEAWLREHYPDSAVTIRPAGIYGPDRVPNCQALKAGLPIDADPTSYLNLIHVDDLATVLQHVSTEPRLVYSIYNVSDGHPVLRSDYYQFIATKVGAPAPNYALAEDTSTKRIRSRSNGNKRINTDRLRTIQSIQFQYPSYKEGLSALL